MAILSSLSWLTAWNPNGNVIYIKKEEISTKKLKEIRNLQWSVKNSQLKDNSTGMVVDIAPLLIDYNFNISYHAKWIISFVSIIFLIQARKELMYVVITL